MDDKLRQAEEMLLDNFNKEEIREILTRVKEKLKEGE